MNTNVSGLVNGGHEPYADISCNHVTQAEPNQRLVHVDHNLKHIDHNLKHIDHNLKHIDHNLKHIDHNLKPVIQTFSGFQWNQMNLRKFDIFLSCNFCFSTH